MAGPYQTDFGASLANLISAFAAGTPTALERRQLESDEALRRAQIGKLGAEETQIRAPRTEANVSARMAEGLTAQNPEMAFGDALAQILSGPQGVRHASAFGTPEALNMVGGLPDETRANLLTAGGNAIGVNDSVSIGDRESVRTANAENNMAEELAKIFASPVSTSAGAVTTFGQGDPRQTVYGRDTMSTAEGRAFNTLPLGLQQMAVGPKEGGTLIQDPATGEMRMVGGGPMLGVDGRPRAGLTTSAETQAISDIRSAEDFYDLAGRAREILGRNRTTTGIPGMARRAVQSATGQVDAVGSSFGVDLGPLRELLNSVTVEGEPVQFDPDLPVIDQLYQALLYQGAAAIAGQEGRAISDADVRRMERMLGDPRSFNSTPEGLVAKLESAEDFIRNRAGRAGEALNRGVATGPAPEIPLGTIEQGDDGDYEYVGGDPGSPQSWRKVQ